jgi:hypothetical protein
MRVEPFDPRHFARLAVQPHQADWKLKLAEGDWGSLCTPPHRAWSALADDGRTLACAGFVDLGGGKARAWSLLAGDAGRAMAGVTRAVKDALEQAGFRRVDIEVASGFEPARRWAAMLGFQQEGVMRAWFDDGSDAELWSRLN